MEMIILCDGVKCDQVSLWIGLGGLIISKANFSNDFGADIHYMIDVIFKRP